MARSLARNQDSFAVEKVRPDVNCVSEVDKVGKKRGCMVTVDRLCGLVVRVSGYRYRGPGFDPRRYQIF